MAVANRPLGLTAGPLEVRGRSRSEDAIISAVLGLSGRVAGEGVPSIVSTAAGRLALALGSASVDPAGIVSPQDLAACGRRLLVEGQAVFMLSIVNGQRRFDLVDGFNITGSRARPLYELTLSGPVDSETFRGVPSEAVAHVRLRPSGRFGGLTWLQVSGTTGAALVALEQAIALEASGSSVGSLIASRAMSPSQADSINAALGELQGGAQILPGTSGGERSVSGVFRLGPDTPQAVVMLRESLEASVGRSLGLPPGFGGNGGGSSRPYPVRSFAAALAEPAADLVSMELGRVSELQVSVSVDAQLRSLDLAPRLGAVARLLRAGFSKSEAARLAGFSIPTS